MTKLKKTVKAYGRIYQKVLKAGKMGTVGMAVISAALSGIMCLIVRPQL